MSHHGGHGYTKTKEIRKERRARAELVAQETGWSKLSIEEKLARLPEGGANKQRAKLLGQLQKQKDEAAQKVAAKAAEKVAKDEAKAETAKKKTSKK